MNFKLPMPFGFGRGESENTLTAFHHEVDKLFEDFSKGVYPFGVGGGILSPKVDVSETDKEISIHAELPGLEEKDIEVELRKNQLILRGEKKVEREEKGKQYYVTERSSGNFMRSFYIPFDAKPEQIDASFAKGVLKISIPKPKGEAKKANKVKIKAE